MPMDIFLFPGSLVQGAEQTIEYIKGGFIYNRVVTDINSLSMLKSAPYDQLLELEVDGHQPQQIRILHLPKANGFFRWFEYGIHLNAWFMVFLQTMKSL